jgi:hypothetical protein
MRKSWLTAASALVAVAAEAAPASAQLFSAPGTVNFGDTLVGSSSSKTFNITVLSTITSGSVSAATAPFSGGPVSIASDSKAQIPATYSFAPTARGSASDLLNVNAVNLSLKIQQHENTSLQGIGVAPVESVSTSASPVVRIGTSGLETVSVSNVGDGNLSGLGDPSDLLGSLSASNGVFQGSGGGFDLTDGAQTTFDYNFTPTGHGAATGSVTATFTNGSADGKNQASSQNVSLSGQGVGPQYASSLVPGVIDLGAIKLGATATVDLKISNLSIDANGGVADLADLSLLAADLNPLGPGLPFSLENFVPDTILGEGESFDLKIDFSATKLGEQTATLVIATDQNAAFGGEGQTFDYQLMADVVPSPVPEAETWEMLLAGFSLLGLQYRRGLGRAAGAARPARPREK